MKAATVPYLPFLTSMELRWPAYLPYQCLVIRKVLYLSMTLTRIYIIQPIGDYGVRDFYCRRIPFPRSYALLTDLPTHMHMI